MPTIPLLPIFEPDAKQVTSAPTPPLHTSAQAAAAFADDDILELQVGRVLHDVPAGTLRRAGAQSRLCALTGLTPGSAEPKRTAAGRMFVPCDGVIFDHLVNWLRCPKLPSGLTPFEQTSIARDAHCLGLDELYDEVKQRYPLREIVRSTKYTTRTHQVGRAATDVGPYLSYFLANRHLGDRLYGRGDQAGATRRWTKAYGSLPEGALDIEAAYVSGVIGPKSTVQDALDLAHGAFVSALKDGLYIDLAHNDYSEDVRAILSHFPDPSHLQHCGALPHEAT